LENDNLLLSTRNVQSAKVVNSFGLNIYDLLYHDSLIISETAVKELEDLLGPKKEAGSSESSNEEPAEVRDAEEVEPKRTRKPGVKTPKQPAKRKKEAA
jgi:hypothetical protein